MSVCAIIFVVIITGFSVLIYNSGFLRLHLASAAVAAASTSTTHTESVRTLQWVCRTSDLTPQNTTKK